MLDSCEALIIRISLPGSSPGELTYMAHRYQTLLALITVPNLYNKTKYTHRYSYIRCSLSFIRELSAHSRLCSVSFIPHGGFWVLNSHCSLYPTTTHPHTYCTTSSRDTHSFCIQPLCSSTHLSKWIFKTLVLNNT